MSIFSTKKVKSKEVEIGKPRAVNGNIVKSENHRHHPKNAASNSPNAALGAGARTIQRAQVMAASRKRMDGETPDYSIEGAAKSDGASSRGSGPSAASLSAARQAAQSASKSDGVIETSKESATPAQKSSKAKRHSQGEKKKKKAESTSETAQSGVTATKYESLPSNNSLPSIVEPKSAAISTTVSPPYATPLQRQESPTFGHDGKGSKPVSTPKFTATAIAAQPKADGQPQSRAATPQDIRVGPVSRNDSGLVSKFSIDRDATHEPKSSRSSMNGPKSNSIPLGIPAEDNSNRSSRSSTYISRLDPGPTGSTFAEPVEFGKDITTADTEDATQRPRQTSRPQKFQLPASEVRKDRRSSSGADRAPQPVQSGSSYKGLNKIVAASQGHPTSPMHSSGPPSRKDVPFAQPPRSSTPPPAKSRALESQQEAAARTFTLPTTPAASVDGYRTAPTSKPNTPPRSFDSKHRKGGSADSQAKSQASVSYFNRPAASPATQSSTPLNPALTQPSTTRNSISEMRPPLSILAGLKVNKRGHVLDEEGEVIGELFEGDLIDCVRQRCDANGDVLDESGMPVGRVRTVIKGTILAPRWSMSSSTAAGLPLANYNWARRDSAASQQTFQTHHTQLSQLGHYHRASVSRAITPAIEGNVFVAELDASSAVEAEPVIDHTEPFSPFPGAPRTASPAVTPSEEKPNPSQPSRRDSSPSDPPPPTRKWTSRYFESNPLPDLNQPQPTSRRPSTTSTSTADAKNPTSLYGALSPTRGRAVIGPTLSSLMEQDPALFSPQPSSKPSSQRVLSRNVSSPDLASEISKSSSTTTSTSKPRPSSTPFGPPAPGLGGKNPHSHAPVRRSPLGNATPVQGVEDGRARSQPPPSSSVAAVGGKAKGKKGRGGWEGEDAAPAPEISLTRWQERRLRGASTAAAGGGGEGRWRRRLSFLPGVRGGGKE